MAIEWSTSFETGEQRIDDQHKRLFGYVRQLEGLVAEAKAGQVLNKTKVEDLMIFLDTYVNIHFAYEEMCMTIRKCPFAQQNRDAHNKLLGFYDEFSQAAQRGVTLEMLEGLSQTLSAWLVNHICNIDVKLRDSISS